MRVLAAIAMLALAGCTAPYVQTAPPAAPATAPAGATTGSGQGAVVGRSISPAGEALLEQSRRQRRAGEFAQASASVERAIRIEPDHPAVWLELGQLRFEQGDYAQAEQMGRKSLSLAGQGSVAQSQAAQLIADAQRAGKRP